MKAVAGAEVFTVKGDILVGGALTASNLLFNEQGSTCPARRTRLAVIPGGSVIATAQSWLQSGAYVQIDVYSNATFSVANNGNASLFWGVNAVRPPMRVYRGGRFSCAVPFGGSAAIAFCGDGQVCLADTGSKVTAEYPVTMDGVTFAVKDFTAGHPLVLKGSPTWGAMSDWTYGLAPITLPAGETLAIDTDDIDGNGAHTVTLAAKETAGKLVVKGAGTLKLAVPQNVGAISFVEGTSLAIDDGILMPGEWKTVLTLSKGATVDVDDLPFDSGKVKVRVVETDDEVQIQAKSRPGALLIVR